MYQKQLWESGISRKDASQWPSALLKLSLFQNGFLTYFAGLNPLGGTIGVIGLIIPGFQLYQRYLELLSYNPHYVTTCT